LVFLSALHVLCGESSFFVSFNQPEVFCAQAGKMSNQVSPQNILDFWYSKEMQGRWFSSTPALDDEIRNKFEPLWRKAAAGELEGWQETPKGCLALTIVLDQFPLNMFRGKAESFSTEQQAVRIARQAIDKGYDRRLPAGRLAFLYMPLMHSENLADQDLSVRLFEAEKLESNLRFAQHHRELIRKYGRFPHRNSMLGRQSTPEEIEYLASKEAFLG
jgi:uncharacterized protein (DUF924 family)